MYYYYYSGDMQHPMNLRGGQLIYISPFMLSIAEFKKQKNNFGNKKQHDNQSMTHHHHFEY